MQDRSSRRNSWTNIKKKTPARYLRRNSVRSHTRNKNKGIAEKKNQRRALGKNLGRTSVGISEGLVEMILKATLGEILRRSFD